jgi:predicted TIM-barrel fold metal-dependent hydrolase
MLWRFDKNWKAELAGVPWLRRPPSEAILGHFYSTTYPLEKLPAQDLAALCDIVHADRTLLFSSNYPSWEYGDPFAMAEELPAAIQRRVLVDNALALYGDRLLAKNG